MARSSEMGFSRKPIDKDKENPPPQPSGPGVRLLGAGSSAVLSLRSPPLTNQVLPHFELCSATWSNIFPRPSWASPPFVSHDIHRPANDETLGNKKLELREKTVDGHDQRVV